MPDYQNPHYDDSEVFYDAGFFYADGVPDSPTTKRRSKNMSSLKPNLSKKNPTQLIALADLVLPKIAPEPPAVPPIANLATKAAALKTVRDAAFAANKAYEDAKLALANLKQVRDEKADLLRIEHNAVVSAVESEAKGDPVVLTASGYPLAAPPGGESSLPEQIRNLNVTQGDEDGVLDVNYDPDAAARTYEVQTTTGDPVTGPWVTKAQPTVSSMKLTGLTSGSRVWVRVRGVGSKGAGPWSDPASKIVP